MLKLKEGWWAGYMICCGCGEAHLSVWWSASVPVECPNCGEWLCYPILAEIPHTGVEYAD